MKYGLIGEKIGHSFSPQIHRMLASYEYQLRPVPRDGLEHFINSRDFCGLNVTIPYKKAVMPFCDHIDPDAVEIGSVNTLVVKTAGFTATTRTYRALSAWSREAAFLRRKK